MSKEIILLVPYLTLLGIIVARRDRGLLRAAFVAVVVSFVWTFALRDVYSYTVETTQILGVNMYAFIGWSFGLLVTYVVYRLLQRRLRLQAGWQKLVLVNVFYIPLLLLLETVAYHAFGVVNSATATYAGLPVCDCLHAPLWMQISYFAMGSVYLSIILLIERGSSLWAAHRGITVVEATR